MSHNLQHFQSRKKQEFGKSATFRPFPLSMILYVEALKVSFIESNYQNWEMKDIYSIKKGKKSETNKNGEA